MTRHADLIAKLEAAPEGSRELDAKIAIALWPDLLECRSDPELGEGHWIHPRFGKTYASPYTTSLDAALTLIDETWAGYEIEGHSNYCYATVHWRTLKIYGVGESDGNVALAFCRAWAKALNARAVEEGE